MLKNGFKTCYQISNFNQLCQLSSISRNHTKHILIKINIKTISMDANGGSSKIINFVTGNKKKFEEATAILKAGLPEYEFRQVSYDLPEIQGEPEEIVNEKLKYAMDMHKTSGAVVIEDTSLCFNALKGLPGPYIKFFLAKLGNPGLHKLVSGYEDQSAYSQCIFGLAKSADEEFKLFKGTTDGKIVYPRGDNKFGWDPVFQPDGFEDTFAEMDSEIKNTISHRYRALKALIEFLKSNPDYL